MIDFISQLQHNINERVPSERDRLILKLKYIDGYSYNKVADSRYTYEIIDVDVRQIRRICKRYEKLIYKGLNCPHIDH